MKNKTNTQEKLSKVEGKERFVAGHAKAYYHNGRTIDLRTVDTATAEALANDPKCGFLQWADATKRPAGQVRPKEVLNAAPAKQAAAAEKATDPSSGKSGGK